MLRKKILITIFTILCAFFTLLAIVGITFAAFATVEDEFSQFPEYGWMHMPVLCLLFLIPLPVAAWVAFTTWYFVIRHKKISVMDLVGYLRISFWMAILQALVGFLLPFTVSSFLHEGNPAMVIAWIAMTSIPLFVACIFSIMRRCLQANE